MVQQKEENMDKGDTTPLTKGRKKHQGKITYIQSLIGIS